MNRFGAAGAAILFVVAAGCAPDSDNGHEPSVSLRTARDFGYLLGDSIDHALSIELDQGQTLDTSSLPQPGPVNDWLIIRGSRWTVSQAGSRATWLIHVDYQVFKGVREPEQVPMPPLSLRLVGQPPREIRTPAWSFTLVPLIPPGIADEQIEPREPAPPSPAATSAPARRLRYWLTGAGAVLGLIGLRRWLRKRRPRPFAAAARQLRSALAGPPDAATLQAGLRALHRAFDQTFGETLFAGQIQRFCRHHPSFAPLQDRLAAFFTLSQLLFFEPGRSSAVDPATRDWLNDLARRCAAAERQAP